jgi:hypothetical protein
MKVHCQVSDCKFMENDLCTRQEIFIIEKASYDTSPAHCNFWKLAEGKYKECEKCGSREFFCGCI